MAERDVAINLLTKLQDKGFKDLEKSTNKSGKLLGSLEKKLAAVFSVTAITAYGKASVKAFLEEEKAIRRLNIALGNTGQGLKALQAEDFINNLQRTARVADDELRPALTQLINAGIGFEQSQKLLKTALDVSAGSGKDLENVTQAITRAFSGNKIAAGRLIGGLTKAQVSAARFEDIVALLNARFSGQADAAAATYAGRLRSISIAADVAKETIGEGLVKALDLTTASGAGAEVVLEGVSNAIASLLVGVGAVVAETREGGLPKFFQNLKKFAQEFLNQGLNPIGAALSFLQKKGQPIIFGTPTQLELVKEEIAAQERLKKFQKEFASRLKIINKLVEENSKKSKKAIEDNRQRNALSYKFDIEAINQQAALRRNLSASDKDRLLQLIALKISDYQDDEEAIKTLKAATEGRYTEAMALEQMYALLKKAGFAQDKAAIDALAALNPKIKFTDNLNDIIDKLTKIIQGKYNVNIGATITIPTIPAPGIPSTFDPAAVRKGDERSGDPFVSPPPVIVRPPTVKLPAEIGGEPFGVQPIPFIPDTGNFRFFDENDSSYLRLINDRTSVPSNFDPANFRFFDENNSSSLRLLNDQTSVPSNFDPARFRMRENGVTVNVNVSGSVISQNDLVAAVTDAVYQTQRTGNALVLADR
jgi:hypothetical protein